MSLCLQKKYIFLVGSTHQIFSFNSHELCVFTSINRTFIVFCSLPTLQQETRSYFEGRADFPPFRHLGAASLTLQRRAERRQSERINVELRRLIGICGSADGVSVSDRGLLLLAPSPVRSLGPSGAELRDSSPQQPQTSLSLFACALSRASAGFVNSGATWRPLRVGLSEPRGFGRDGCGGVSWLWFEARACDLCVHIFISSSQNKQLLLLLTAGRAPPPGALLGPAGPGADPPSGGPARDLMGGLREK